MNFCCCYNVYIDAQDTVRLYVQISHIGFGKEFQCKGLFTHDVKVTTSVQAFSFMFQRMSIGYEAQ